MTIFQWEAGSNRNIVTEMLLKLWLYVTQTSKDKLFNPDVVWFYLYVLDLKIAKWMLAENLTKVATQHCLNHNTFSHVCHFFHHTYFMVYIQAQKSYLK